MKKTYYKIAVLLLLPLLYYAVFTGFSTADESAINSKQNNPPPGPSAEKDFVIYLTMCFLLLGTPDQSLFKRTPYTVF